MWFRNVLTGQDGSEIKAGWRFGGGCMELFQLWYVVVTSNRESPLYQILLNAMVQSLYLYISRDALWLDLC